MRLAWLGWTGQHLETLSFDVLLGRQECGAVLHLEGEVLHPDGGVLMSLKTLTVPELSLVLLIGPSGAGKSTFAEKHFSPWEVLSSDNYRGVLTNDPNTLDANKLTFEVLEYLAAKRLERGLLTVIDATSVRREDRGKWVKLARQYHVLPVAIVLDVPVDIAHARNQLRPDRDFGKHVVRNQVRALQRSVRGLKREGFRYIHRLEGVPAIESITIERPRPWTDRRDEKGPFDLIGDVHGCREELDLNSWMELHVQSISSLKERESDFIDYCFEC